MRFSVLGSGSRGNATMVSAGSTTILIDAGFSGREIAARLEATGQQPGRISAIVLTHEHGDHTRGAGVFARSHGTPLYMTAGTRDACGRLLKGSETVHLYRPGFPVTVDELEIEPFITVHDAREPVAVAVSHPATGLRVGIATDMGRPGAQAKHALAGCDALVMESNHDREMLWAAAYPAAVKSRIASSHGHLSNQAAARLALELLSPRLCVVVLAHLSEETNTPALARSVMEKALRRNGYKGRILVAASDRPTPLLDLAELRARNRPAQLSLFGTGPEPPPAARE